MVPFNKSIRASPETLPTKQKCILNSKLASEDNVHKDTIRQQLDTAQPKASTSKNSPFGSFTHHPKPLATSSISHRTSVEDMDNEDDDIYTDMVK